MNYRNASINRQGAYLIFCLLRGGGGLFEVGAYSRGGGGGSY